MWGPTYQYGLDLSCGIASLVQARIRRECGVELLGGCRTPLNGLRGGRLLDEGQFRETLRELTRGICPNKRKLSGGVCVGLGGHVVQVTKLKGQIQVPSRSKSELYDQVEGLLGDAARDNLGQEIEVLRILPYKGVLVPEESNGKVTAVYAEALALSVETSLLEGIRKSLKQVGLTASRFTATPLSCAEFLLPQERLEDGHFHVHLGSHTTTVMHIVDGLICQYEILKMGSDLLVSDLAFMLQMGHEEARDLLMREVTLVERGAYLEQTVPVKTMLSPTTRQVSRQVLGEIVRARLIEIIEAVHDITTSSPFGRSNRERVIVTGPCTQIPEFFPFTSRVLGLPTHLGEMPTFAGHDDLCIDPHLFQAMAALYEHPEICRHTAEQVHAEEKVVVI